MADWPYNTTAWQKLRSVKLAHDPLCEACLKRGEYVDAKAVDHVVAIRNGGDPLPPLEGLQSLCQACHTFKTQSHDMNGGIAFKGCDANGLPIDPSHPFFVDDKEGAA